MWLILSLQSSYMFEYLFIFICTSDAFAQAFKTERFVLCNYIPPLSKHECYYHFISAVQYRQIITLLKFEKRKKMLFLLYFRCANLVILRMSEWCHADEFSFPLLVMPENVGRQSDSPWLGFFLVVSFFQTQVYDVKVLVGLNQSISLYL